MASQATAQTSAATLTTGLQKPTQEPQEPEAPKPCKFCKRPGVCPGCNIPLGPPKKEGPINIDGDVPDIYEQLPKEKDIPNRKKHKDFVKNLPPDERERREFSVFTAGSIEMGNAIQWQPLLEKYLWHLPIAFNNPRRGSWDPNITPSAKDKKFREQVEWELQALQESTVIAFFFDHATMSPVTLCELGLWAHSGKVVVCCDKQFWKGGNVHLVCERYGVPLVESFTDLVPLVKAKLAEKGMVVDKKLDPEWKTKDEGKKFCDKAKLEVKGAALNMAALGLENSGGAAGKK